MKLTRECFANYPRPTATLAALGLAASLNLPAYASVPNPNVRCTGAQPVQKVDFSTSTADGVFEALVDTPPADDLKHDGTMQRLAEEIVTDPAVLNPTVRTRDYHVPLKDSESTTQVGLDEKYPGLSTFYLPQECHLL